MGLKYLSIKTKLFILSIIPMFIILILSAIVLTNIFKDKKDLQITKIYIDKAEKISKIIHLLQLERALSLELLTDPKSTRVEKLKTINRELDILIQNEKEFQAILSDRKFIQLKDSSVDFIYEYYSKKISVLLDMVILIPNSINSIENRNYIQAYTYLATAKENLGRIRAVLNRAFLQKEMSREDFIKLLELSSSYNTASCRFQSSIIGFNIFSDFYKKTINDNKAQESLSIVEFVLKNSKDLDFDKFSSNWFEKATLTIDALKTVENKLFTEVRDLIQKKQISGFYEMILIITFLTIAIIALIYEAITIVKDILNSTDTMEQNLSKSTSLLEQYKLAIDQSTIVSKTDKEGNITYANSEFCTISGYMQNDLIGKAHNIVRHPDMPKETFKDMWHTIQELKKPWSGEIKNIKKDGSAFYVKAFIIPILDKEGDVLEYIGIKTDITDVIKQKELFEKAATTDALTGYGNRYKLSDDIAHKQNLSLALFNIDSFRELNDFYGHKFGDSVIKAVAYNIHNFISRDNSLYFYRLQGDEFAILAEGYQKDFFIYKCKDMLLIIKNSFTIEDKEIVLSCSCGISFEDKEDLLTSADMALKIAKQKKQDFIIYDKKSSLNAEYENNIKCAKKLTTALQNNKFVTFYQPIVNNITLKYEKHESLVRMIDEEGKVISPFFFLDTAKKIKKYFDITKLVITQTFEHFKDKKDEFSINLSIEDILNTHITTFILEMLKKYNVDKRVVFEIVESEYIQNFEEVFDFITRVKRYGCKIAIDDFGTGYSNFEYLIKLRADYLKIDGSLIKNIDTDKNSYLVVSTIVEFAKKLGLKTVAEYVENENIFTIVKEIGIDYSQGYYFGSPKDISSLKKGE